LQRGTISDLKPRNALYIHVGSNRARTIFGHLAGDALLTKIPHVDKLTATGQLGL